MASCRVITAEAFDADGTATSSAIDKLDGALGFARDLIENSDDVLQIEDAAGAKYTMRLA